MYDNRQVGLDLLGDQDAIEYIVPRGAIPAVYELEHYGRGRSAAPRTAAIYQRPFWRPHEGLRQGTGNARLCRPRIGPATRSLHTLYQQSLKQDCGVLSSSISRST